MVAQGIDVGQRVAPSMISRARELRRQKTPEERMLWQEVRNPRLAGLGFRRQPVIDGLIVDFYCHVAGLVIEVDGSDHAEQAEYDRERDQVPARRGLRVLRVANEDMRRNLPDVLSRIAQAAQQGAASPEPGRVGEYSPSPRRGGGRGVGSVIDLDAALREHFGHSAFRPGQREVVAHLLAGRDVLAVMPTGAGKSLCYQLAGALLSGPTLVVSPLIALMKDQVDSLPPGLRERATLINSSLDAGEIERRLAGVAEGRYRLVYAAPERLRQRPFLHALARASLALVAVDEAHCLSLWGHDFRPDYLFVGEALKRLGQPLLLAMSATATPTVRDEIAQRWGRDLVRVTTGAFRPNLFYRVDLAGGPKTRLETLARLVGEFNEPGIIYVRSRNGTEKVAANLRDRGLPVAAYHAGLSGPDRVLVQDDFMSGRVPIVAATVAFGMGIDKPDVRQIVHVNLPASLEAYAQESGRAGRDGRPARCTLLYSPADAGQLTRWLDEDKLTIEHLRKAYSLLRRQVPGRWGRVNWAALGTVLRLGDAGDDTAARVAVSLLEHGGFLERRLDAPQEAWLSLRRPPDEPAWLALAAAIEEATTESGTVHVGALARRLDRPPDELEAQLLAWRDEGLVSYRPLGREPLIVWRSTPDDAPGRIQRLLAEREAGQQRRLEALFAYARASDCRHGRIARHFGESAPRPCGACDNCTQPRPIQVGRRSTLVATAEQPVLLFPKGRTDRVVSSPPPPKADEAMVRATFAALKAWRLQRARADAVPPYLVAHDRYLQAIAEAQPRDLEILARLPGMGPAKLAKYGAEILAALAEK